MSHPIEIDLPDLEATQKLAQVIAEAVQTPATIALEGTLGTGKTQFVRYFAETLGVPAEEVTSPTYVLLQRYRGRQVLHHFDWYRLNGEYEVWDLGIDELYEQNTIVLIEWADKFPQCLPNEFLRIKLAHERSFRTAKVEMQGPAPSELPGDLKTRLQCLSKS